MSNSFAIIDQTVMGSWRVMHGTLTMDDSATGEVAPVGLRSIYFSGMADGDQVAVISHYSGGIIGISATSGLTYDVIVMGV